MKVEFNKILSILLAMAFALAACQPVHNAPITGNETSLKVLAVETFLADIAQNVAGDRVTVENLIPLGLDPHAFEPTPQDVKKIAESNVLIVNGAGFETWLAKTLENAGGERQVIEASSGLTSRAAREGEEAVMTAKEKGEALCTDLSGKTPQREGTAGVEKIQPTAELLILKLIPNANGSFGGSLKLEVAEDGEYVIAAREGTASVTDASGGEMGGAEILPMNCSGLGNGILLDLEPGQYVITLSGLAADTTPFFAGTAGGHHPHEGDPHFWLDPTLVVKYVENIRDGLIAADPAGKDVYTKNAADYVAQLNTLDAWIKTRIAQLPTERRLIVTNHESFGYFADRYGFKIIGTIVPSVSTGASPSAQQLARLVDHIRKTGAIVIFLETGASPQLAEQVANETGVKVVTGLYSHSITEPGGKAPTYIEMMKYNVNLIVEALK